LIYDLSPFVACVLERRAGRKRCQMMTWLSAMLMTSLFVACGDDTRADADERLDGREFLSQSVDGHSLVPGTRIRLSFEGGQIGARAGCNLLGAPYAVTGGRLVVQGDGMTTTDMGCDPARHAQDEWLAEFLRDAPRLDLDGDSLTLTTTDATLHLIDRVIADPDRPLLRTQWRVDTVIDGDAASSVPAEHPVTLEFDNGKLTAASAGCTSAQLDIDVDSDRGTLRFGDFVIDTVGCPPPWEQTVTVLRSRQARYSITAARLTITSGKIGIAAVAA
jgi:heat shock protein HslJ